jgi:hypothetical protein
MRIVRKSSRGIRYMAEWWVAHAPSALLLYTGCACAGGGEQPFVAGVEDPCLWAKRHPHAQPASGYRYIRCTELLGRGGRDTKDKGRAEGDSMIFICGRVRGGRTVAWKGRETPGGEVFAVLTRNRPCNAARALLQARRDRARDTKGEGRSAGGLKVSFWIPDTEGKARRERATTV